MSFPRAKTRRFNEEIGCAPGVGYYNPKTDAKSSIVVFDKTSRFQEMKGSSSMDHSFVAPRSLTKVQGSVSRSTGSLHESNRIMNGVSCPNFGSHESLSRTEDTSPKSREFEHLHSQWTEAVATIKLLHAEKRALEEMCENMKVTIQLHEDSAQTLSSEIQAKEEHLQKLESTKISNEVSLNELGYQLNFTEETLAKLKEELHELLSNIKVKDEVILDLENKGCEAESTVMVLQNDLVQKEHELLNLEAKWLQTNSAFQDVSNEVKLKDARIESLESNLSRCQDNLQLLQTDSAEIRQQLFIVKEKLAQAISSCELLKLELATKDDQLEAVMESLRQAEVRKSSFKDEIQELAEELQAKIVSEEKLSKELRKASLNLKESDRWKLKFKELEVKFAPMKYDLEQKDQQLSDLEFKWLQSNSALQDISNEIKIKDSQVSNLESSLSRCQDSLEVSQVEAAGLSQQLCTAQQKLAEGISSCELLKLELSTKVEQLDAAMESLKLSEGRKDSFKDDLQELADELQAMSATEEKLSKELEQVQSRLQDSEQWKLKYEELEAKIAPFKEQLDAYALERNSLIQENDQAFKELSDLGQKYAQVMGHQNHKQKIQYVTKLKQENYDLKKELSRLRTAPSKSEVAKKPEAKSVKKTPMKSSENIPAYF